MSGLVMFDYDGVIVDSFDVFTSAFFEACRKCSGCRLDSTARLMGLFDGNLFEGMKNLGMARCPKIGGGFAGFHGLLPCGIDSTGVPCRLKEGIKTKLPIRSTD